MARIFSGVTWMHGRGSRFGKYALQFLRKFQRVTGRNVIESKRKNVKAKILFTNKDKSCLILLPFFLMEKRELRIILTCIWNKKASSIQFQISSLTVGKNNLSHPSVQVSIPGYNSTSPNSPSEIHWISKFQQIIKFQDFVKSRKSSTWLFQEVYTGIIVL